MNKPLEKGVSSNVVRHDSLLLEAPDLADMCVGYAVRDGDTITVSLPRSSEYGIVGSVIHIRETHNGATRFIFRIESLAVVDRRVHVTYRVDREAI